MDKQIRTRSSVLLGELVSAAKALGAAEYARNRTLEQIKRDEDAVSRQRRKLRDLHDQLHKKPPGKVEALELERLMTQEALAQYKLQQTCS